MMKKLLKQVLNLETILSCYVGAIGYGVGYNLPTKLGANTIVAIICCLVLGTVFDLLAKKLLESNFFKKSKRNKIYTAIGIYAGYLIAWVIVDYALDYDLDYDFMSNIGLIILFQVVLILIDMFRKYLKEKRQ